MPSQNFSFTGAEATIVVPAGVTSMAFDMAGAQGGNGGLANNFVGRFGARLQGTLTTTPGETLRIRVGGRGNNASQSRASAFYQGAQSGGNTAGDGGGSTDIRRGGTADSNRVAVAAGAGGAGNSAPTDLANGGQALDTQATGASAATNGTLNSTGGGGSGWRGGAGGDVANEEGQGGTSMAHSTQTSGVSHTPNFQVGDGYVTLSWTATGSTAAQRFYGTTVADDQTFTSEATIRGFDESAPANNTGTTITWTTTTITEKTLIPGAANSASGDTSMNSGFAFRNASGASNLSSTATQNRWIKAGVWNFSMQMALNTAALLDTHALTITAKVYRVPSGGGARTLLFTATSENQTASATVTWASASQPEYILGAGEVIMVGFTATSASTTATLFGANTNTVMTVTIGTNTWVEVPSPGIRTISQGVYAGAGLATPGFAQTGIFSGVYTATATATTAGVGGGRGSGVFTAAGAGSVLAIGASRHAGVFLGTGLSSTAAVGAARGSGVFSAAGLGSAAAIGMSRFSGVFTALAAASAAYVGASKGAGVFSAAGQATPAWRQTNIFSGVFVAAGSVATDFKITNVFSGAFTAAGQATTDWKQTNLFSGVFSAAGQATTLGRITNLFSGVFSAAGVALPDWRASSVSGAVFTAAGVAAPLWRITNIFSGVFVAEGSAVTVGIVSSIFSGVFTAVGSSSAAYLGTGIFSGVFVAEGTSEGTFTASSLSGTVFSAAGSSVTDARGGAVVGGVFAADVSQGGSTIDVPPGVLYLRADGRVVSLLSPTVLPPGYLKIISVSEPEPGSPTHDPITAGAFAGNGTTGTQSITGVGYTPGFVFLMTTGLSDNTASIASVADVSYGVAIPSADCFSVTSLCRDNTTATDTRSGHSTTLPLITASEVANTNTIVGDIEALTGDPDGFVADWSRSNSDAFYYMAFPPTLDTHISYVDIPAATGLLAVTGLGFTPKLLIILSAQIVTADGVTSHSGIRMGASSGPGESFCGSWYHRDALNSGSSQASYFANSLLVGNDLTTVTFRADLDSFDADGFTLDVTTAPGAMVRVGYVAVGGDGFYAKAGTRQEPAGTGNESVTGVGFEPTALMLMGRAGSMNTLVSDSSIATGMTDFISQSAIHRNTANATYNTRASHAASSQDVYRVFSDNNNSTPAPRAVPVSADADGWTLNWIATGVSHYGYVALRVDP